MIEQLKKNKSLSWKQKERRIAKLEAFMERADSGLNYLENHYAAFVKIEALVAKDRVGRAILAPREELRDISEVANFFVQHVLY